MNNTELKTITKRELALIQTEKLVLEQSLNSVTRREYLLKEVLEKLGAPAPPRKEKYKLDPEIKLKVIASLTR